eukprot:6006076-Ditylum_brightwellii.AAC.1
MASQTTPMVEDITTDFPQPTILKISGQPDNKIDAIYKKLMENETLANIELGGGTCGLLGLV